MGRRRSEFICPRCQRKGSLEYNKGYRRVIHYNSVTKTRTRCYVEKIINDEEIKKQTREFEKKFSEMSPIEVQDRYKELIKLQPHNRNEKNEMKAELEALEYISLKRNLRIARYRKQSAEVPPKDLWGESSLYNEVKGLAEDYRKIYKHLDRVSKYIYQFKPEKKLSDRLAHRLSIFRKGPVNVQKLLLTPYDRRFSADWIKWIDIHLTRLEHSKGYAGSKHALETGEYAVQFKGGKEINFTLKRGITRDQVGKKEKELFKMVQQMIIGIPMIQALNDWSYETSIMEEYDEQGNLIK
ncbi:MAG: hypothetical protein WCB31_03780 [Nitrososphaeraceae archaeon]